MRDRWQELAESRNWDPEIAQACREETCGLYEGASRHYHNLDHIAHCLDLLESAAAEDPESMRLAIWFHDVIYDTTKPDNEAASGIFAKLWLAQLEESRELCVVIERLIQITDHKTEPATADEKLLIDIDLSILGSDPEKYDIYVQQIRKEYAHVPDADYREGRVAVLRKFLGRTSIYWTGEFQNRLEEQARINLENEIKSLS